MRTVATILLGVLMASCQCHGFTTMQTTNHKPTTTALQAKASKANNNDDMNNGVKATAAALLLGYTLIASPLAGVADTSLDFSLPSYDAKMSGFGDGSEARLYDKREMTDPGANEREKQMESMRKAEEARKEASAKKKAEAKAREEEDARRAREKKARDAERLKNIWAS